MQFKLGGRAENPNRLRSEPLVQYTGSQISPVFSPTLQLELHRSRAPGGVEWPSAAFPHQQLPMEPIRNVSGHSRSHITKSVQNSLFSPLFSLRPVLGGRGSEILCTPLLFPSRCPVTIPYEHKRYNKIQLSQLTVLFLLISLITTIFLFGLFSFCNLNLKYQ